MAGPLFSRWKRFSGVDVPVSFLAMATPLFLKNKGYREDSLSVFSYLFSMKSCFFYPSLPSSGSCFRGDPLPAGLARHGVYASLS